MVPIKSNRFLNRYPPLDYAEMKSQPCKLQKITALMAIPGGYGRFLEADSYLHLLRPTISTPRLNCLKYYL
ncbi:hypothetical protein Hanom_Chr06g00480331 [Helianthus anomalus]